LLPAGVKVAPRADRRPLSRIDRHRRVNR
jgi:hypothetical protein